MPIDMQSSDVQCTPDEKPNALYIDDALVEQALEIEPCNKPLQGIIDTFFTFAVICSLALFPITISNLLFPQITERLFDFPIIIFVAIYALISIIAGIKISSFFGSNIWNRITG